MRSIQFVFILISLLWTWPIISSGKTLPRAEQWLDLYLAHECKSLPQQQRPRVGLVLSGGGARGFTHIGVLKILEGEKIPLDILAGTSIGALVGALYAAGLPVTNLEMLAGEAGWDKISDVSGTALVKLLVTDQLIPTQKMEDYIVRHIGNLSFAELKIPFACVATDLRTGEKIIFREGSVAPAVRASTAIPGIFQPVEYRHRSLVDGGVVDNVPTAVAQLMGAELIIVSLASGNFTGNNTGSVLSVLNQAISIQEELLSRESLSQADIVIQPPVGMVNIFEVWRSRECIREGIHSARQKLPEIRKTLIRKTLPFLLKKDYLGNTSKNNK